MSNRKSEFTIISRIYGTGNGEMTYQVNLIAHANDSFPWGLAIQPRVSTYEEAEKIADVVDKYMQEYKSEIIAEYKEENESKT